MTDPILSISAVGKRYITYRSNLFRFASWFGFQSSYKSEFWAVKDISFALKSGETLSLIGQNGAGKSTLLKLITGTVRSTTGTIQTNGRVSAILELGIGFNPEFTGRENIFQSGGMLGFSPAEITEIIPNIEDFAELGDFFDQPLRIYSSGMQARLAFALATAVRPEILIVDEVLSVGDSYFQHKSFDRIRQFREQGTSIILVTHSMGTVKELSDRVILLDEGCVVKDGLPDEVVDYYNAIIAEKENTKLSIEQRRQKNGWLHTEYGNHMARVRSIDVFRADGNEPVQLVEVGAELEVRTEIEVLKPVDRLVLGHRISDKFGHIIFGTNTWHTKQSLDNLKAGQVIHTSFRFTCDLGPGSYSISFGLHQNDTHLENCYHKADNQIVFDVFNADKPVFIGSSHIKNAFEISVQNEEHA